MKISVIIPAYNVEKYIERSINSVLIQTHKPFEIIVVDDGSTDKTEEIVKSYKDKTHYTYQTNQGSSSARNFGIKKAKGDWIAFLDSDDEWVETHLENFIETYRLYPEIKWYGAPFKMLEEVSRKEIFKVKKGHLKQIDKHTMFDDYMSVFPPKAYLSSPTMVIHKSIFNEIGYFDTSKKTAIDVDMWFRIGMKFPKIGYTYKEAAIVYRRDFSLSTSKKWNPVLSIKRFKDCETMALELGQEYSDRAKPRINYWVVRLLKSCIIQKDIEAVKEIESHFSYILFFYYRLLIKLILRFPFILKMIN